MNEFPNLQERLDAALAALDRMQDQRDQATRQCGVMAEMLRDAQRYVRYYLDHSECDARIVMGLISDIDAAMAGKLPEPTLPKGWNLVEKANCFTLVSNGQVIASMAGPKAEGTAAILASVLDGKAQDPAIPDDLPDLVLDRTAEAMGETYDCSRSWSAWSYGTMGPDDFHLVVEDSERVIEIAKAAITAWVESTKPESQQ